MQEYHFIKTKKNVKKVPKIHSRCHKVPNILWSNKKRQKGAKKGPQKVLKKMSLDQKSHPKFSSIFFFKAEIAKITDSK